MKPTCTEIAEQFLLEHSNLLPAMEDNIQKYYVSIFTILFLRLDCFATILLQSKLHSELLKETKLYDLFAQLSYLGYFCQKGEYDILYDLIENVVFYCQEVSEDITISYNTPYMDELPKMALEKKQFPQQIESYIRTLINETITDKNMIDQFSRQAHSRAFSIILHDMSTIATGLLPRNYNNEERLPVLFALSEMDYYLNQGLYFYVRGLLKQVTNFCNNVVKT